MHLHSTPPPPNHPIIHSHQPVAPIPTQTQPLDLGFKEESCSPVPFDGSIKRKNDCPSPQEFKKQKLEAGHSVVSILAVNNDNNSLKPISNITSRVDSPVSIMSPSQQLSPKQSLDLSSTNVPSQQSLQNNCDDDEKSSKAPGYVHKLKKAWMQRHENGGSDKPSSGLVLNGDNSPQPSTSSSTCGSGKSSPNINEESNSGVRKSSGGESNGSNNKSESKGDNNDNGGSRQTSNNSANGSLWAGNQSGGSAIPNGHRAQNNDSSSTSSDDERNHKPRRPLPSSGNGKGKRKQKSANKSSDSNSDSDKESDASESSFNGKKSRFGPGKEPKKRGRKPKGINKLESNRDEITKPKDENSASVTAQVNSSLGNPPKRPPTHVLKKTGESFLQDGSCYEVAPKLPKCRECRWTPHQRSKKQPNIFCRFYAFRRLRFTKTGALGTAGFSDPGKDASAEDMKLWEASPREDSTSEYNKEEIEKSKYLINHVGDQLCDLVSQEKQAKNLHMNKDGTVAWKRVVQGVREMCDVCETTLFNVHWTCSKCGFVVCIDCYRGRKNGTIKVNRK